MGTRRHRIGIGIVTLFALLLIPIVPAASADTQVLFDGPAAQARCTTSYPGVTGPDELSSCQWDMQAIDAGAQSQAIATGKGVKVGVIDGGVDFTHPDLAGAIDVAKSCSFIYSNTPTANPAEIANGDCSNKAAVQDLQGHGTHVATTIAGRKNGIGIVGVVAGSYDRRVERLHHRRFLLRRFRRCRRATPATSGWTSST